MILYKFTISGELLQVRHFSIVTYNSGAYLVPFHISIDLSLIASSKTSRVEMESILEMQIGGFLERLENDFGIISKVRPLFTKPNGRSVKYKINVNFLSFWFRFIYKYRGAIETGNLGYVKDIVLRDYTMYSGTILEKYFIEKRQAHTINLKDLEQKATTLVHNFKNY